MRRAVNKVSNVSKWQNGLKRMQSAKISSGTESIMLTSSNSKVFKQNNPE